MLIITTAPRMPMVATGVRRRTGSAFADQSADEAKQAFRRLDASSSRCSSSWSNSKFSMVISELGPTSSDERSSSDDLRASAGLLGADHLVGEHRVADVDRLDAARRPFLRIDVGNLDLDHAAARIGCRFLCGEHRGQRRCRYPDFPWCRP